MSFVGTNRHMTTKLHTFDIQCPSNSKSYDQHIFFGTKFRGSQNFSFTMGGFSDERACSGADPLDSFLPNKLIL